MSKKEKILNILEYTETVILMLINLILLISYILTRMIAVYTITETVGISILAILIIADSIGLLVFWVKRVQHRNVHLKRCRDNCIFSFLLAFNVLLTIMEFCSYGIDNSIILIILVAIAIANIIRFEKKFVELKTSLYYTLDIIKKQREISNIESKIEKEPKE